MWEEFDAYLSKKQKEYIQIALDDLGKAEKVIQDYLTFAKPCLNKAKKLNVEDEVRKSIRTIMSIADNKVRIRSNFKDATILGETTLFQKCLINILENAIEAMPSGGVLSIDVHVNKSGHVIIHIQDTGIGMSIEQINRLGEPFFSTKEIKGTGLGLMVAFRIVEVMGGNIHVESELNKGTSVYIKLPLVNEDEKRLLVI